MDEAKRLLEQLVEIGKTVSATNKAQIMAAIRALRAILAAAGEDEEPADKAVAEAAIQEARTILTRAQSWRATEDLISAALRERFKGQGKDEYDRPWVRDYFGETIIYEWSGKLWQAAFTIDRTGAASKVILGQPAEVELAYIPVGEAASESAALLSDVTPLIEKAVRRDGTVPIKVIQPGWGSSGYYSKEVLARDAGVFAAGTQMFWDHPTAAQESERPERSLRDLAGVLVSGATYREDAPSGPGLYADAKLFGPYREAIEELAPHIGVSIRAQGRRNAGEAEGRKGPIVERISRAGSVDFVTAPGAGGKILELFEAARGQTSPLALAAVDLHHLKTTRPDLVEQLRTEIKSAVYGAKEQNKEARKMGEEELARLKEANEGLQTENARFREQALLREAREFVVTALAKHADLPELTRARLTEALAKAPIIKDGSLDQAAYTQKITEALAAEIDYLSRVMGAGRITGMGGAADGSTDAASSTKKLESAFGRLGLTESAAKIAARGRE